MRRPAIGILLLDYEYSGVPGGLQDHTALEYETRVATVRGLSFEAAKAGTLTPGLEAAFRDAVDELQTGGGGDLVGISGNCGFMMFYQELVRGLAGVPVFMSPLLQAPLVAGALPPSGIILVLTASKADLMAAKEVLLTKAAIRVDDRDQVPRARNRAQLCCAILRNSPTAATRPPRSSSSRASTTSTASSASPTRRAARWTSRKSSAASSRA